MTERVATGIALALCALFALQCGTGSTSTEPVTTGSIAGTVTFVGAFDKGMPPNPGDSTALRDTTYFNVAAYLSTLWDPKQNRPLASPSHVILLDSAALATGVFSYSFTNLNEGDYYIFARATKIDPRTGRPRFDSTFTGSYRIGAASRDSLFHDTTNPLHPPAAVHVTNASVSHAGIDFFAWASADSVRH